MESKKINDASLQEAWNRFVEHSETIDDLKLMVEIIRKGNKLQEDTASMGYRKRKKLRKEAARIIAAYERKQKTHPTQLPSRTITRFRKIWYAAAAAILLGLLIPAAQIFMKPNTEQTEIGEIYYNVETTGRGEIKTIILPDQTKVTLNVESSLKYPDVFADARSVELQGGAIFEVTPDSIRPFTVATTDMNIKVLGTVFDVKAYPEDESAMVSVASGKVEVAMGHAPLSSSEATLSLLLEKNHQLKIDKTTGHYEKSTIDARNYLSWTDGVLFFNETPIREVVLMLNRFCPQMVFELAGEYPNLISGALNTKKVEKMLDPIVRSFGLKYKKTENKIILYQ